VTTQQAKQVLLAYRPWAATTEDAEMAEALALARTDAELAQWFALHCTTQNAMREKFQSVKAPDGLRQQILSERAAQIRSQSSRRTWLTAAACAAIVIAAGVIWKTAFEQPRQDLSFNGYRNRMARTALRAYGMDLETNNLAVIQAHLAANQAPVDYSIPESLTQTPAVGCGVLRWQNKPVTMVCYQTGKALPPGLKSDLILFVINQQDVNVATAALATTEFRKVSEWFTASWRAGDKIYLLAALDEGELRRRL
jgi:hypothetical protein